MSSSNGLVTASGQSWSRRVSVALGLYVFVGGLISFLGWVLDRPSLASWGEGGLAIQPNAALCAIFMGASVLVLTAGWNRLAMVIGGLGGVIAWATLFEWVAGVNLGIDTLFMFGREWGRAGVVSPGRMGIPASVSLTVIGAALALTGGGERLRRFVPALALVALTLGMLSTISHLYGASTLYTIPRLTAIAFQTATFVVALSLGVLLALPDRFPTSLLCEESAAGALARRALPVIVLLPVLLGWLRVAGQNAGLFDVAFGTTLRTVVEIVLLTVLMGWALRAVGAHERANKSARDRLAAVIGSIDDALVSLDRDFRFTFANDDALSRWGGTGGELLGQSVWEQFPGLAGSEASAHLRRAMTERVPVTYEFFHELPQRWYRDKAYPEAGGGLTILSQDITERKAIEESLRESEARVRSFADTAPAILWVTGPDARCSFLSRGWYEFTGQAEDAGLGLGWLEALHPDDRATAERRFLDANGRREPLELEHRVRRRDGQYRWVLDAGRPRFGREGRFLGHIGSVIDIHDRKCAEDLVRRSRDTFYDLVANAPLGVYVVDSQFKVREVSAGSQKVFESVRPLIGRDFAEVLRTIWPEPFATRLIGLFHHTLETGQPYHAPDTTEQRADIMEVQSYDWQIKRVTLPDGQFGVVCYFYETTQLRRAEYALREADRRKDEFLATLAHELRNPLAPITTWLELMQVAGDDIETVREARQTIHRQVSHMAHLIDDLMDVSRIARDKLELRLEQVELRPIIRHAIEACRASFPNAGHDIVVSLPSEPMNVKGDTVRLGQVLGNLLNNASKYSPSGSKIEVAATIEGSDAVVRVRDHGIGIPEDKLLTIFEMFSQLDCGIEKRHGGLGIGLHLVKKLVELHGGRVEASSAGPGQGSEFVVRVPLSVSTEAGLGSISPRPIARGTTACRRILVVDDNADAARSLARLLRHDGHDTQTAHDGAEAITRAEAFQPDVVLLDIGLPTVSGYDACRAIRQKLVHRLPVMIALTGWGQAEDRQRSLEAGFDTHLVKPIDYQVLARVLSQVSHVAAPVPAS